MNEKTSTKRLGMTGQILIGMLAGIALGLVFNFYTLFPPVREFLIEGVLFAGGKMFIALMKMLVVPIVFVSLVCGTCSIGGLSLGRIGIKTMCWYLLTTSIAISLALLFASFFAIGDGAKLIPPNGVNLEAVPSIRDMFINMIPSNPFNAMAKGEMLQIIIFAILFGCAINISGRRGLRVQKTFKSLNHIMMNLIIMIMKVAPYGVFCLLVPLFARFGFKAIEQLAGYFMTVVFVLLVHVIVTNSLLLKTVARLKPLIFFRKMYSAMIFAFSTSSSNASIPVVLEKVEKELGVKNKVAAFVIPLGATINMDGTAIMQGVATVFIANAYQIHIGLTGYLTVLATATLASIGTAGIPSVGLITLAMVLQQVGLPVEGTAMIMGVDRLLDMLRTAVNITGDATVSCLVAKSEKAIDHSIFNE